MNTALSVHPPQFLQLLAHELRWSLLVALARSDHRGQELVGLLGQPQNLVSYHLRKLIGQHLVTERRSAADSRDFYYSLNLDRLRELYTFTGEALHPALNDCPPEPPPANQPPRRVLFLCTHNSARSQMAEAILRHLGGERFEVFSAGSQPAAIHPEAARTLAALGIDSSNLRAKHLDEFTGQVFDLVITVCDQVREVCPVFPGGPDCIHWSFADPAAADPEARPQAFRDTARQLTTRIGYLLTAVDRRR